MLLTLTSTAAHASDLGYLLHKHPERVQSFELSVGVAHVFYPEATDERCTVALLLEVDPVELVRGRRFGGDALSLAQYVNDRPYAASSMLSVALGRVFGSALKGRCDARPELVGVPLPLEVHVPALPSRGGADVVSGLFEPLGWSVSATVRPLDPELPAWGDSRYVDVVLRGTLPLDQALSHLYVLLPVLDGAKHYWVSSDEVDKLIRSGGSWLQAHPERDAIVKRYLAHKRGFVADALARLAELDESAEVDVVTSDDADETEEVDPPALVPLSTLRKAAVVEQLKAAGAQRVVDLGCGEGALLRELLADPSFTEIVGADVAPRVLERAAGRLHLDRMGDRQRARITLLQSSVIYRDDRLAGFDAVVLMEVVEHVDPERLPDLERTVFGHARPRTVVVTTPNAEYNVLFEGLAAGTMRHSDHRFEWTRAEFADWAERVAAAHGYTVAYAAVGEPDPGAGPPTQLATFTRTEAPA
ncbi:3' terminal RNA ribose 2'-O-methyltransferase Hen1 [Jiangella alkaliphila]|uniref:Small RNA 2'-O-methyltransferase n=1 Tax=Jiangella alkaliphila TaxID=419479 RepID=A0A1H2HQN0_9ACTN|nr:3' terminal RNA ribose 2'-O-methyltransferase Hen1 [Jiangella alkaliphila]SDU34193.1 3' terminal RNA ribose 2'-O-methyltransferase Hen1 [Jiangella alkaliphila]